MQASQQESASSSEESSSQLRQKAAFQLPEVDDPELESDEAEAFAYLKSVRSEATSLIKKNKKIIKQNRRLEKHTFLASRTHSSNEGPNEPKKQQLSQPPMSQFHPGSGISKTQRDWHEIWMEECLQSWQCIVSNLQYLHKHMDLCHSYSHLKSSPEQMLASKPKIHYLPHLSLDQVEELLASLSQWHFIKDGLYYHLWMYSLLAAHRSLSPYSNFQALGSVNAGINKEGLAGPELLLVVVVLENRFGQRNLVGLRHRLLQALAQA